jgi:hypothetical protein
MTRYEEPTREQLRALLDTERKRFQELDKQKKAAWLNNDLLVYMRVKMQWQDCADEIDHLHRKLYPLFPYSGTCYQCGAATLPVAGMSPVSHDQCVACKEITSR